MRPEFKDRYKPYNGGLYAEISPPNPQGFACVLLGPRVQAIDIRDFDVIELDVRDPDTRIGYRVRPEFRNDYPPYDGAFYRELRHANHAGFARVLIGGQVRWVFADHFNRVLEGEQQEWRPAGVSTASPVAESPDPTGPP